MNQMLEGTHTRQKKDDDDDEMLSSKDVANQMYGEAYSLAGVVRDGTETPEMRVQSLASVQSLSSVMEDENEDKSTNTAALSVATAAEESNSVDKSKEVGAKDVESDKNSTASNKLDDDTVDKTRSWANTHYNIKDINETDPVYGHKVFKDEMNKFLPYQTKKPVNRKWQYGWHQIDADVDHSNDWDTDLKKGGDKATEGYYPGDEEDEEKTWARRNEKYNQYGPWNYKWGTNFYNNGGYNGNPNWYGGQNLA